MKRIPNPAKCPDCDTPTRDLNGLAWCSKCECYPQRRKEAGDVEMQAAALAFSVLVLMFVLGHLLVANLSKN